MSSFALKQTSGQSKSLALIRCFALFALLLFGSSAFAQAPLFESDFQVKTDSRSGVVALRFSVPEGWHCYSTTQVPGGPLKSKIVVTGEGVKVMGDFVPLDPPESHFSEVFGIDCEEHQGTVVWQAPIELDAGVDPAKVTMTAKYTGQICMNAPPGSCKPVNEKVTASFAGLVKELPKVLVAQADTKAKESTPKKFELEPYQPKKLTLLLRDPFGRTMANRISSRATKSRFRLPRTRKMATTSMLMKQRSRVSTCRL